MALTLEINPTIVFPVTKEPTIFDKATAVKLDDVTVPYEFELPPIFWVTPSPATKNPFDTGNVRVAVADEKF